VFVTVPLSFIPVFCFYIAITIYDIRHKIIPDSLVYPAIFLSLIEFHLLAGATIFFFFAAVWLLSRGKAMGFGDAKLGLSIGLLLGAAIGFSAIIVAFWLGALFGLASLAIGRIKPLLMGVKNITMKSEVPFAPFIVLGAWLAIIFRLDLLHVSLF
jgi:prepilin signal peptidase PulO-like enzyme (type II secretory pathway)